MLCHLEPMGQEVLGGVWIPLRETCTYICCAHSGTSTRSLRSLGLCASRSYSPSLCSLGLCTFLLQRSRFALAYSTAWRSTITIIKLKRNKRLWWETNLHVESSPDLQSNALKGMNSVWIWYDRKLPEVDLIPHNSIWLWCIMGQIDHRECALIGNNP